MSQDGPETDDEAFSAQFAARLDAKIAEHGHTTVWIAAEADFPAFTYSVGLTECGWPELICMNLGPKSGIEIVNCVISKLRSTETKPHHAMIVTEALNVPVYLLEIGEPYISERFLASQARIERVGQSGHNIRGFQVVWPDTNGLFPWDHGYDSKNLPQILLGIPPKSISAN